MLSAPQVVVVAPDGDVHHVLPPHAFLAVGCRTPDEALAHVSELRARSTPVVLVLASRYVGNALTGLVMELARRHPEVPVVVATESGDMAPVPRRTLARPARSLSLAATVNNALRSAAQYSRVRTTLDRLNVRLSEAAPPDPQQHRRLTLSSLYLAAILDQAREGIVVTDRSGTVALWNRAAVTLFGRDAPASGAMRVDDAIGGAAGPTVLGLVRSLSLERRSLSHDLVVQTAEGTREVEASLSLVCDAQDHGLAVCLIARDVTADRGLQRELESRARALAESNRHKDEFLAVLSHELRTPLNAVLGWTQILASTGVDNEQVRRATEMIARNAQLQRRLVEDLLDYARIAAGRLPVRLEPADVGHAVRTAVAALRPGIDGKRLRLSESYEGGLRAALDPERFGQVITNLVSNAIKFTPEGGELTVGVRQAQGAIEIRIADTGRGIAADFLAHVFDEFRQADQSSTRAESGLGLGLAIARRIVDLHGGEITALSDGPGRGTTFVITLHPLDSPSDPETGA